MTLAYLTGFDYDWLKADGQRILTAEAILDEYPRRN
jgi:hypothetical protein